jgi:hypothetical protein
MSKSEKSRITQNGFKKRVHISPTRGDLTTGNGLSRLFFDELSTYSQELTKKEKSSKKERKAAATIL